MCVVALDYETYYSETCSVEDLGAEAYVDHPEFDCYCISLVWGLGPGENWVGDPRSPQCPWHVLRGTTAIAHNKWFEICVTRKLVEWEVIPADCLPEKWRDTADLAAFFRLSRRRSLKEVMKAFKIDMSKDIRNEAKGRTGKSIINDPEFWPRMKQYCLEDSQCCFLLWSEMADGWPEDEQVVADLVTLAGMHGIRVDVPEIEKALVVLEDKIDECRDNMPWVQKGCKPMSIPSMREHAETVGLEIPDSTDKKNEEWQEFLKEHAEEHTWLTSMSDLRAANKLHKVLDKLIKRTYPDGIAHVGLRYSGAHTLRWSGDEINLQNLNKKPVFGINLRNIILARPGHVFVIFDFSQSEPRMLFWTIGDEEFLQLARAGHSAYESYARKNHGYVDPRPLKDTDPVFYSSVKARVIALGYGIGAERFSEDLRAVNALPEADDMIASGHRKEGLEAYLLEATRQVYEYRSINPRVKDLWGRLEGDLRAHAGQKLFEMKLPSGNSIPYFRPREVPGIHPKNGRPIRELVADHYLTERTGSRWWGGSLTENYVQAASRDIVAEALVRIYRETDHYPLFTSHDEVVYEVPEVDAKDWYEYLGQELVVTPSWAEGLPLAVEGMITPCYTK